MILCDKILSEKNKTPYFRDILRQLESRKDQLLYFWWYREIPIVLMQEVITYYYLVGTEQFTPEASSSLCVILNIFQVLVVEREIMEHFLAGQFPFYLYPFLNITEQSNKYESIRIACLCIIGTLLNQDIDEMVNFLKNTEIVPMALKIMDIGSEVAKIITINIFYKILNTTEGLEYMVQTFDRFVAISMVFNSIVYQCLSIPSKHVIAVIIDCYIRMCQKDNVKESLQNKPPDCLMNDAIIKFIESDAVCKAKYINFMDLIKRK